MGCVYSYPLFSFQGSTRLFSDRKSSYQKFSLLSSTFFKNFPILFFCLSATNNILSSVIHIVKHFFDFFSKSFLALSPTFHQRKILYQDQFILSMFFFQNIFTFRRFLLYFIPFSRDIYLLYLFYLKCQHLFSFFTTFLFPFIYIEKDRLFPADLPTSSIIIMLSFLLRSQPVSFLPFWKCTVYMQHHL